MGKLLTCAKFCFFFSIFSCLSLCSLAIALMEDYQYIKITNRRSSSITCFYSALIYFILGIISLIILKRKPRTHLHIPEELSKSQGSWPE